MESSEQTELTRKIGTDPESRMTTLVGGWPRGIEEFNKKEKGLMNKDNSVVIVGVVRGRRGYQGNKR